MPVLAPVAQHPRRYRRWGITPGPLYGWPILPPLLPGAPLRTRVGARLTSPYGWRRDPTTGRPQMHQGIDIAVPVGTPLFPPLDGAQVLRVHETDAGGLQLTLRTPDGSTWSYAHLLSVLHQPHLRPRSGAP